MELRKAAILLMSLPEEDAGALMRKLSPSQLELVATEIARIGPVSPQEQRKIINDFADAGPNSLGGGHGDLKLASTLLRQALGRDSPHILDNVKRSVTETPFDFLRQVDPQNLMTFILDEHPQTIALILSYLPPRYGAQILAGLTADRQVEVMQRIATMGQTSSEVVRAIEDGLAKRMSGALQQAFFETGGVASVAEILDSTERATGRSILERLADDAPELANEVRQLMFAFEDISELSDTDIQTLHKNIDTQQWAMALKGASEELRERVLSNLSKRAAGLLLEEIEFMGAVRRSEVETYRRQVVDTLRMLEDQGLVNLAPEAKLEELVN